MTDEVQEISLYDVFAHQNKWVKLPTAAMRECGPAAQTLGATLRWITNKETYMSAHKMCKIARQPLTTFRRHMQQLDEAGFIKNLGRQKRRSPTIRILQKARTAADHEWGVLPSWAMCNTRTLVDQAAGAREGGRMPWGSRAVLSIVLARLAAMRAEIERQEGQFLDGEELWGAVEHFGGEDKFKFSLAYLESQTGLRKAAIVDAKQWLNEWGILTWNSTTGRNGGYGRDCLYPSYEFRVTKTPAGEDSFFLDYALSCDWS